MARCAPGQCQATSSRCEKVSAVHCHFLLVSIDFLSASDRLDRRIVEPEFQVIGMRLIKAQHDVEPFTPRRREPIDIRPRIVCLQSDGKAAVGVAMQARRPIAD